MSKSRSILMSAAFALAALASGGAWGGVLILIDQPGGSNYSINGQDWFDDEPDTFRILSAAVPLNFGSGVAAQRFFQVDPAGRILFTSTLGGAPTGDYIAPFYSPSTTWTADTDGGGFVINDFGFLNRQVLDPGADGPYDLPSYRFLWAFVCPNSACQNTVSFEAVLTGVSADAFVLQFFYLANTYFPSDLTAGFSFGGNAVTLAGRLSAPGPDFCVTSGVARPFTTVAACRAAGPSVVPEPETISLAVAGLAAIGGLRRRKRPAPR